jgi:hypothetical protein
MAKKAPTPRISYFFGMRTVPHIHPDGSWLEGEEFCYPNGGLKRRAYARCEDGELRLFKADIADTMFSVPAAGKIGGKYVRGFLSGDENGLEFTAFKAA